MSNVKIPYNNPENNFRYLWLMLLQFYVIDLKLFSPGMEKRLFKVSLSYFVRVFD